MTATLSGSRILVVEDEFFLALEISDALERAGAQVIGPVGRLDEALGQVRHHGFDLAVVDINLGGNMSYPVADALDDAGIPFLFASAYDHSDMPSRHAERTFLQKPYGTDDLISGLVRLVQPVSGIAAAR